MELFLCWSGEKSRQLALFLRGWIPAVLQAVEPWMSESDTDKGTRWSNEIAQKLERVSFAVVCLSGTNQTAPWVNFESGAVSKLGGRVATVCLDLRKSDVVYPLGMFQATDLGSKDDIELLVLSINAACGDRALEPDRVRTSFDRWWPDLEAKVAELRALPIGDASVKRDPEDLLDEILDHVRAIAVPSPVEVPDHLRSLISQPYPVGDVCQILSGMRLRQRSASHNRSHVIVDEIALKSWQLVALHALSTDSNADIVVSNADGSTLFTSRTTAPSLAPEKSG